MNVFRTSLLPSVLLGLWVHAVQAQQPQTVQPDAVRLSVRDTVLPNGLRILIHEDHSVPTVSCRLFYATGSVHESPGETGITHMLEHMLFKGTRRVGITDSTSDAKYLPVIDSLAEVRRTAQDAGDSANWTRVSKVMDSVNALHRRFFVKDELWQAYKQAGGTDLNAFTTKLGTVYFVTLPRNRVELYFWLESDRMQNAVMRDFYAERDVVREERRMRIENKPEGRYWETLDAMFWGAHPYSIPTIGWPSDIEHYRRAQVQEHYDRFYGPKNAILVLSGDVSADTAFKLAERYLGPIHKGAEFPKVVTTDPEPVGQKRFVSIRENARPSIDILFPVPPIQSSQSPAFEILQGVLSGAAGRLQTILVDSLRLCTDVGAEHEAQVYASQFDISAMPAPGADPVRIEKILWEEIGKLRDSLLTDRELRREKNRLAAADMARLRSHETIATDLGFMAIYGDWHLIQTFPAAVQAQTAQSVREAAAQWLLPQRATVGWLLPKNHSEHTRTGVYQ
jgi:predicted Zn-dependent peptidase